MQNLVNLNGKKGTLKVGRKEQNTSSQHLDNMQTISKLK